MSTLKTQLEQLNTELKLKESSTEHKAIVADCRDINNQLISQEAALRALSLNAQTLRCLPDSAPKELKYSDATSSQIDKAELCLNAFAQRWQEEGHRSRKGDDLANASESLRHLVDCLRDELEAVWEAWKSELAGKATLETFLFEQQKIIPGKKAICEQFESATSELDSLLCQLPTSTTIIERAEALCFALVTLKSEMDFELSPEVTSFLESINRTGNKVALRLLTPEVLEWLRDNQLLDNYVVSRWR